VYGFNVSVPQNVSAVAKSQNVPVRLHKVIYKLIDDVKEQLTGRLLPLDVEEQIGELGVMCYGNSVVVVVVVVVVLIT